MSMDLISEENTYHYNDEIVLCDKNEPNNRTVVVSSASSEFDLFTAYKKDALLMIEVAQGFAEYLDEPLMLGATMAKAVEILEANTMDVAVDVRKVRPFEVLQVVQEITGALRCDALMKTNILVL
jgi:hypothetical protein